MEVYSDPGDDRNKKVYFGSTQGEFKTRYYNHRTSFSHENIGIVPRYLVMCGRSKIKKKE